MLDKKIIQQIKEKFKNRLEVLAIYCFGSASKNRLSKESDIDLAFLIQGKKIDISEIYDLIKDINFSKDIDISIISKSSSPLFLYEIVSSGQLIYHKNDAEIKSFEAFVLKNYYDNAHMRNIYYQYLKGKFESYANQ